MVGNARGKLHSTRRTWDIKDCCLGFLLQCLSLIPFIHTIDHETCSSCRLEPRTIHSIKRCQAIQVLYVPPGHVTFLVTRTARCTGSYRHLDPKNLFRNFDLFSASNFCWECWKLNVEAVAGVNNNILCSGGFHTFHTAGIDHWMCTRTSCTVEPSTAQAPLHRP